MDRKTRKRLSVGSALLILAFSIWYIGLNSANNQSDVFVPDGYTVIRGLRTATDGRLTITVNNYQLALAKDIFPNDSTLYPTAAFLMVNVTISNDGGGNASIVSSFHVYMWNGTKMLSNQQWVENAYFSDIYPHQAYPTTAGGYFLPPGQKVTMWVFFYYPHSESLPVDQIRATTTLSKLVYLEHLYGGDYLGNGEWVGDTRKVNMEFVITI